MDCRPPSSSVHGTLQARILEWVAIPFFRGSFWPRDWTHGSCISYISCIRQAGSYIFKVRCHGVPISDLIIDVNHRFEWLKKFFFKEDRNCLKSVFSKCGPRSSSIYMAWELVRDTGSLILTPDLPNLATLWWGWALSVLRSPPGGSLRSTPLKKEIRNPDPRSP